MSTTAAQIIAAARADAPTPAALDREVAIDGWRHVRQVRNAIWAAATAGHRDADWGEMAVLADQLNEELAPELDAWAAECRQRKYVGWSRYSTGPVRYADEPRPAGEGMVPIIPDVSGYPPDVD